MINPLGSGNIDPRKIEFRVLGGIAASHNVLQLNFQTSRLETAFKGDVWIKAGHFSYKMWVDNNQVNFSRYNKIQGEPLSTTVHKFNFDEEFTVGSGLRGNNYSIADNELAKNHFLAQVSFAPELDSYKLVIKNLDPSKITEVQWNKPSNLINNFDTVADINAISKFKFDKTSSEETLKEFQKEISDILNNPNNKHLKAFFSKPEIFDEYIDYDFLSDFKRVKIHIPLKYSDCIEYKSISDFVSTYLRDIYELCGGRKAWGELAPKYRKFFIDYNKSKSARYTISRIKPKDVVLESEKNISPEIMVIEKNGYQFLSKDRSEREKMVIVHWQGKRYMFYRSISHTDGQIGQWRYGEYVSIAEGYAYIKLHIENTDDLSPHVCEKLDLISSQVEFLKIDSDNKKDPDVIDKLRCTGSKSKSNLGEKHIEKDMFTKELTGKGKRNKLSTSFIGGIWIEAGSYAYEAWVESDKVYFQRFTRKNGYILEGELRNFNLGQKFQIGRNDNKNDYIKPTDEKLSRQHFWIIINKDDENNLHLDIKNLDPNNKTIVELGLPQK